MYKFIVASSIGEPVIAALIGILGQGVTLRDFAYAFLFVFVVFFILWVFAKLSLSGPAPIRMLLSCDRETARELDYIMRKERISFNELHANSCAAMGYFLPLYGRVVDDRPIAWSGETKAAIVFAMIRGRIHRGMRRQEFIQVIAEELKHFRDDESPVTDSTRQVDGIMF